MSRRLLIVAALLASACTSAEGTSAEATSAGAGPPAPTTSTSAASVAAWPDDYGDDENGAWATGAMTVDDITARARQKGAKPRCIALFLDATGAHQTLEWTLYLRDGDWILYGSADGAEPESYDGGRYLMYHVEGELATFSSFGGHPDSHIDYYLYPRFDEPQTGWLTMNLIATRERLPDPASNCFVRAAVAVELTNPFEKVA